MILTEEQLILRKSFRKNAILMWRQDRAMFTVYKLVAEDIGSLSTNCADIKIIADAAYQCSRDAASIPSINKIFSLRIPVKVWFARHYPSLGDMLFDGATNENVLCRWQKTKYQIKVTASRSKRSLDDTKVIRDVWKNRKMTHIKGLVIELGGDPWSRSDWNKVK